MKNSFSLGLRQVQPEVITLQNPGFYWVTCARQQDMCAFIRQVISQQHAATLISAGLPPRELLTPDLTGGPDRIPLFSLPANKKSLLQLERDLSRTLSHKSGLVIFSSSTAQWDKLNEAELRDWITRMRRMLRKRNITLLIVTTGITLFNQTSSLQRYYRHIDGLAYLTVEQDSWLYQISWWYTGERLFADRTLRLGYEDAHFFALKETQEPLSLNDEQHYLADKSVLEGAPPLSRQWQLFDDNQQVWLQAQQAHAATVIFSLNHSEQIGELAKMVHSLRRARGNGLKIVVREMGVSLRYSDERLLQACGVNTIVPTTAAMSRFLTMLEGIQGQRFSRRVPASLDALIASLQPLHEKGYLRLDAFCEAVSQLISNTLLPENDKGLLVALRPVPQLTPQQVLTLCKPRRFGDLVTVLEDRVILFLSSCRYNDLDKALKFIFSLPHDELFANRIIWFEDNQILAEIGNIKKMTPMALQVLTPVSDSVRPAEIPPVAAPERPVPQPITLLPERES
ncbi:MULTISPECIES: cellulose biosynthesis protein BcsE [unclassified Pantoea]|uniref:cellulose biosynthesis protein BcsE n=1 Tax=unclassified Pantoea TaxID=2630326 RepID=UPI0012325C78|nr:MULTISPECIES: cellulose biosynthesis protein BcsE [unclassified Pantoea]KAA5969843.1 cellulose biosynthesis protein BcsE [Pantoea sp. M_6]KAA5971970.1 cellulose biosynthesis protein BcsE [Pantoea sp. M_8]KAA5988534.1 cellulose biosynthesis protein BcsE [Pantoea sp. M_10]KAA5996764.1 cellulose biosynthesis protein BcsE [Pantoea sp. M_5]